MLTVALLLACKPDIEPITGLDNLPGGNPLVPAVAMFPFPSDFYLADDASTPTGRRVAYPAEALPEGLSPDGFADADGFSRITPILAVLNGGIDPTSLPDAADAGATLDPDSPVLLAEADGTLVPALVEIDRNIDAPGLQTLIVRPNRALSADTTHVVVLRSSLRRADGGAHVPEPAFVALRDGIPTDSDAVEAQRDDFVTVNGTLATLGLDPQEVVLAWSFTTRSEEGVVGPLAAMHDAMAEAEIPVAITSDRIDGDNRLVEGTLTVPDFLDADSRVVLDGADPVIQGTRDVPFLLTVPVTATDAGVPRPVILFGHGFFSSREEPTWSSLNGGLQQWRMSALTVDFLGFNEDDQAASFAVLGGDLMGLNGIVDQQRQSEAQFTALARIVPTLADTVAAVDPDAVVYMGISNGGTQGLPILVASPVLSRGALVVPGGGWSHMLQRAVQWNLLGGLLEVKYADPRDLQLVMALTQTMFDKVDAVNFAEHLVDDRLPGRLPMQVTLHEAVGDCQVSNLTTEWVARTAGVPLVTPTPRDVWGLPTVAAEDAGSAALLMYDEGFPPLPEGNVPPAEDNGAHDSVRLLASYKSQMGTFLETGVITQVCDGACDPD